MGSIPDVDGLTDLELCEAILNEAVRIATGGAATQGRPGQIKLMADISRAITSNGQMIGAAPTGVGKSLGYLAPLAVAAIRNGERSIVATEGLALQAQLVHKDLPVIVEAVKNVTGITLDFTLLKGISNYVCVRDLVTSCETTIFAAINGEAGLGRDRSLAEAVGDQPFLEDPSSPDPGDLRRYVDRFSDRLHGVNEDFPKLFSPTQKWALESWAGQNSGDKDDYPADEWESVATSTSHCSGSNCPFKEVCIPREKRAYADEADIVVTNHAMLAVQAARDIPVIVGRRGADFNNIVVDEAHSLPANIRNQGARGLTGFRMLSLFKRYVDVLGENPELGRRTEDVAEQIRAELERFYNGAVATGGADSSRKEARIGKDDTLFSERLTEAFELWEEAFRRRLAARLGKARLVQVRSSIQSIFGGLYELAEQFKGVNTGGDDAVRWVSINGYGEYVANSSPFDTGAWLQNHVVRAEVNLPHQAIEATEGYGRRISGEDWSITPTVDSYGNEVFSVKFEGRSGHRDQEIIATIGVRRKQVLMDDEAVETVERRVLVGQRSLSMVSATIPYQFKIDVGSPATTVDYESPFATAYRESCLFIPFATPEIISKTTGRDGKVDTRYGAHRDWCAETICDLVEDRGGSALILCATNANAKVYAEALRRRLPHLQIFDDRNQVGEWRADESSVLVGSKSLMTGLDAPGRTCSLVIVDRPSRAPGNIVDDARAESRGGNRFLALNSVYAGDAAVLLEQALGRLIRSIDDVGMVAVLDPRLAPGSPLSSSKTAVTPYKAVLDRFPHQVTDVNEARAWLREQRDLNR